jgi:hypothetical protein
MATLKVLVHCASFRIISDGCSTQVDDHIVNLAHETGEKMAIDGQI